ncbi:VOC family protein [Nostoc ellipsosporum NOK]|uniref:VOC family protein n=1 Tax=Sphingomonas sp. IBVSS2 TaxID=1985172 RepID=UPI000A2DD13C|nr:VOC family protein [Sphingomonas sp. IBVSS2]MDF2382384.1 VOC family protein [Nostoc ellipsosporum NOK]OSZ66382.1 glyoxalase/bleomycin resistance/extradiol dioxygenase family protein [Sphingomonas sp. IBVSS2]
MARISYLELPAKDVAGTRDFYARAFAWQFTDFAPHYAATTTGDTDLGINGSDEQAIPLLLPIVEVQDLEAAFESVRGAGGEITVPIFAFPGGRRFHFRDPAGNELGVFVNEPE